VRKKYLYPIARAGARSVRSSLGGFFTDRGRRLLDVHGRL